VQRCEGQPEPNMICQRDLCWRCIQGSPWTPRPGTTRLRRGPHRRSL